MSFLSAWKQFAHPTSLRGSVLEAPLKNVFIGEICDVRASLHQHSIIGRAQVVGFHQDRVVLNMMGPTAGVSREMVLMPTGPPR